MPTVYSAKDLMDQIVDDQQKRHDDPDAYRGFRFPMPWFMKHVGGLQLEWLWYVYGKGGVGKSAVLSTAAIQNGVDDVPFIFFSLEESAMQVGIRFIANLSGVSRTKFRDVSLDHLDFAGMYRVANQISGFPAYFVEDAWTPDEIEDAIRQVGGVSSVYIDYLQLMQVPGAKTQTEAVSQSSKWAKALARGRITGEKHLVCAAVQLNDQGLPLWSRDPDRDGDLTTVVEVVEDGYGGRMPDRLRFTISKNRHGLSDQSTEAKFIGERSLIGEFAKAGQGPLQPPTAAP